MKVWRLLTTRGRALLLLGLLALAVTMTSGIKSLGAVAVLLILLPLATSLTVSQPLWGLQYSRNIAQPQVEVGSSVPVELILQRGGVSRMTTLRLEEVVPATLGSRPRFAVGGEPAGSATKLGYHMKARLRGHFDLGPLLVRNLDPFGLACHDHHFKKVSKLTVTPKLFPLEATVGGASGYSPDSRTPHARALGGEDMIVREYDRGDDMRRINWKATAHQGRLMVRKQDPTDDPTALLLLDSRAGAHSGTWEHSSFEWAVSAVASIGLHLIARGFEVRLADATGPVAEAPQPDRDSAARQLIDLLTDAKTCQQSALLPAGTSLGERGSDELLIAVVGAMTGGDLIDLTRARGAHGTGLVMLLDAPAFSGASLSGTTGTEHRDQPGSALDRLAAALSAQRWRVVIVRPGDSVTQAWDGLRALAMGGR